MGQNSDLKIFFVVEERRERRFRDKSGDFSRFQDITSL